MGSRFRLPCQLFVATTIVCLIHYIGSIAISYSSGEIPTDTTPRDISKTCELTDLCTSSYGVITGHNFYPLFLQDKYQVNCIHNHTETKSAQMKTYFLYLVVNIKAALLQDNKGICIKSISTSFYPKISPYNSIVREYNEKFPNKVLWCNVRVLIPMQVTIPAKISNVFNCSQPFCHFNWDFRS